MAMAAVTLSQSVRHHKIGNCINAIVFAMGVDRVYLANPVLLAGPQGVNLRTCTVAKRVAPFTHCGGALLEADVHDVPASRTPLSPPASQRLKQRSQRWPGARHSIKPRKRRGNTVVQAVIQVPRARLVHS